MERFIEPMLEFHFVSNAQFVQRGGAIHVSKTPEERGQTPLERNTIRVQGTDYSKVFFGRRGQRKE